MGAESLRLDAISERIAAAQREGQNVHMQRTESPSTLALELRHIMPYIGLAMLSFFFVSSSFLKSDLSTLSCNLSVVQGRLSANVTQPSTNTSCDITLSG
jgi:hypothetical protein